MERTPEEKTEFLMELAEAPTTRLEAELAFRYLHRHLAALRLPAQKR